MKLPINEAIADFWAQKTGNTINGVDKERRDVWLAEAAKLMRHLDSHGYIVVNIPSQRSYRTNDDC